MARPGAYMDYSLQSRVWNEIFKAGLTPAIPPVSPSVHIWRRPNQSQCTNKPKKEAKVERRRGKGNRKQIKENDTVYCFLFY